MTHDHVANVAQTIFSLIAPAVRARMAGDASAIAELRKQVEDILRDALSEVETDTRREMADH